MSLKLKGIDNCRLRQPRGFGGHTTLFCSDAWCRIRNSCGDSRTPRTRGCWLDHGANPIARVSLRKQLETPKDHTMHEYRDVTPLSWGGRFHNEDFVSKPEMQLTAERSGTG